MFEAWQNSWKSLTENVNQSAEVQTLAFSSIEQTAGELMSAASDQSGAVSPRTAVLPVVLSVWYRAVLYRRPASAEPLASGPQASWDLSLTRQDVCPASE